MTVQIVLGPIPYGTGTQQAIGIGHLRGSELVVSAEVTLLPLAPTVKLGTLRNINNRSLSKISSVSTSRWTIDPSSELAAPL